MCSLRTVFEIYAMNERLAELYQWAFQRCEDPADAHALPVNEGVSWPHFIHVPATYFDERLKFRLLVVGQETRGWEQWPAVSPESIIEKYKSFDLGRGYWFSPFWQAAHRLHRLINTSGPERGFVWSNLVKISQRKKRPERTIENKSCGLELLQKELEILKPDAVVFFTGPKYDERLKTTFPGLKPIGVTRYIDRIKLDRQLPRRSFRTYHPRWLRFNQWGVIREIADLILND